VRGVYRPTGGTDLYVTVSGFDTMSG